ncbi:hypothetical protein FUA23_05845 [Neolewinella aurantiaca]|uniref:Uncharacterized protein n=1 Tax=Neolewinella aurantiaca TaxID=2602767 RepID=A0A5C7FKT9_9BACT|nr:hypothetical protein [Neolewinella aurantiaca]TXF90615.1 hypothetical protein FUA23_05845 [Neolewinella aurantiaca]
MLRFTYKSGKNLHYEISGRLDAKDLCRYYAEIDASYQQYGKLMLSVTVDDFRGYTGARALYLFFTHEPALLWKVEAYSLQGGPAWLRGAVSLLGACLFWIRFEVKKIKAT